MVHKIGRRTCTRMRLSLFMYVLSLRIVVSSEAVLIMIPTMKFLIPVLASESQLHRKEVPVPCRWGSGKVFHRVWMSFSRICSPRYCVQRVLNWEVLMRGEPTRLCLRMGRLLENFRDPLPCLWILLELC